MNEYKILVVGELNVDLILNHIKGFPVVGEEIIAEDLNLTLGSSSAIFASNIATLGIHTSFCGMIGKDSFGQLILDSLRNKNVDTTYITESSEHKTGATIVMNYEQDRANVTYCGAMDVFNSNHIPFNDFSKFNHLHFSSYFLQKGIQKEVPELFKRAKQAGLSTSLDIQWDPDNTWHFPYEDCLPYVDVFLPNEAEILALAQKESLNEALEVIGKFANTIIVKKGIQGAVGYQNENLHFSQPFLHDQFVDAIGAGDSFNAGFIATYLKGAPLNECLQYANLSGSVNTTASGGTTAFKSLEFFNQKTKELFNIVL